MRRNFVRGAVTGAVLALAALLAGPAWAEDACPPSHPQALALPHAKRSMALRQELEIVALGSSTTFGWMASSVVNSYPAQLQMRLAALFPKAHVTVLNRGIGGQDAAEEVLRLDTDAIAPKPSIVIWQVGANGALRNSDPEVFKRLVDRGVERMKAAGIEVILMDNQRSPMILAAPEHATMDATLSALAVRDHVQLFSRGALMDDWQANGAPYAGFIATDNLHHNDRGYRCVAEALADSIGDALRN